MALGSFGRRDELRDLGSVQASLRPEGGEVRSPLCLCARDGLPGRLGFRDQGRELVLAALELGESTL